ncbi:MAG: STAS domain-containing protein [Candidatus Zhuqueibacterota bacterium]
MNFERTIQGNVVLLPLEGKLMGGTETKSLSDELQQLVATGYTRIVLDFENVKWINSPGIGALIKWLCILREHGGDLRITHAEGKVKDYLKITKLMDVIKIFDSPQDAVNSYSIFAS